MSLHFIVNFYQKVDNRQASFSYCSSVTSITIPASVTTIGNSAFENCSSLTSATFENPNGWTVESDIEGQTSLLASDLEDPQTAAEYLTFTYSWYTIWTRY